MNEIRLTIDGRVAEVDAGTTVLDAARKVGIEIPTICDHKDLTPYGACRMCIVEIEGVRGYPTSCTTPAAQGMTVWTHTEDLTVLRNRVLELMLSGHPNSCLVCPHRELCETYRPRPGKAGRTTRCGFCSNRDECRVRGMAIEAGAREMDLPVLYSAHQLERDDPFMDRDYNLCILCGRCWRICEKIHGAPAISIVNRGKWARLGTAFNKSHVLSGCTFCGSCIDICPTGSLTDRYARWYGKPEEEKVSVCTLCPEGCSIVLQSNNGKTVAAKMTAFEPDASLCAAGRFAFVQLANSPERLARCALRTNGDQVPVDWDEAIEDVAADLSKYKGSLLIAANGGGPREDTCLYRKLAETLDARFVVMPPAGGMADMEPSGVKGAVSSGRIRAAIVTGDYLDAEALKRLEYVVAVDCLPSPATDRADAVFPAAGPGETAGTYRNGPGVVKEIIASALPPGDARPEWMFVVDLAKSMGLEGFDYGKVSDITAEIRGDAPPVPVGEPRRKLSDLPARFRGRPIADVVPALAALGLPRSLPEPSGELLQGDFEVMEKTEVVPNFHLLKVAAPEIAKYARAGQFVIVMVKETSERVPFTLVDWDAAAGTITLVVEEVGRSSREIALLRKGDRIAHVTGPLGLPLAVEKRGAVVLGGGCYGIGAIYPMARALKEAGNRVTCIIEASSSYLLYMEKELEAVCDELLFATKDGSRGMRGGIGEVLSNLTAEGVRVDQCILVGCTFMMRMVSDVTRTLGIPTLAALNPIMVDGTGMCGACRLSLAGETKFACVDGPIFDAHAVDWDELFSRRSAYAMQEIEALPQVGHEHGAGCGCGGH